MKKIIIAVLILIIAVAAFGCTQQKNKGYVTLTFVTGCDIVIDPIVIDGTEEKYMPDDPMRAGYEFLGWYYDQSFFVPFKTTDEITSDLTLYAKWYKKDNTNNDVPKPIEDDKGIKYVLDGEIYKVIGYVGTETGIVIPARYNGAPVMKIAKNAFSGSALKKISLGQNIVEIENEAFRGAASLEKIEVDKGSKYFCSVDGILFNAKKSAVICVPSKNATETVTLKDVEEIVPYAFEGFTGTVDFSGNAYENIEGFAFAGFAGKIFLGEAIKEIRKDAFSNATCDVFFKAGNGISVLRNGAFADYCGKKLNIPSTVVNIEWQAFYGCTATVDLSSTYLTAIGERAFAGYLGKTLIIPASVTVIGKNAFYGAKTEITFEKGSLYENIAAESFAGFGGSDEPNKYSGKVTFPSSVKSVGKNAFYGSYSYVYFQSAQESVTFDPLAFAQFKGSYEFI